LSRSRSARRAAISAVTPNSSATKSSAGGPRSTSSSECSLSAGHQAVVEREVARLQRGHEQRIEANEALAAVEVLEGEAVGQVKLGHGDRGQGSPAVGAAAGRVITHHRVPAIIVSRQS